MTDSISMKMTTKCGEGINVDDNTLAILLIRNSCLFQFIEQQMTKRNIYLREPWPGLYSDQDHKSI